MGVVRLADFPSRVIHIYVGIIEQFIKSAFICDYIICVFPSSFLVPGSFAIFLFISTPSRSYNTDNKCLHNKGNYVSSYERNIQRDIHLKKHQHLNETSVLHNPVVLIPQWFCLPIMCISFLPPLTCKMCMNNTYFRTLEIISFYSFFPQKIQGGQIKLCRCTLNSVVIPPCVCTPKAR